MPLRRLLVALSAQFSIGIAFVVFSFTALSASEFQPVVAEELKMTSEPLLQARQQSFCTDK